MKKPRQEQAKKTRTPIPFDEVARRLLDTPPPHPKPAKSRPKGKRI